MKKPEKTVSSYWHSNLKIVSILMTFWFVSSFGLGIIFVDYLNQFNFWGFKLGFWFAQQGSIYTFVVIIFVYVYLMKNLDKKMKALKSKK